MHTTGLCARLAWERTLHFTCELICECVDNGFLCSGACLGTIKRTRRGKWGGWVENARLKGFVVFLNWKTCWAGEWQSHFSLYLSSDLIWLTEGQNHWKETLCDITDFGIVHRVHRSCKEGKKKEKQLLHCVRAILNFLQYKWRIDLCIEYISKNLFKWKAHCSWSYSHSCSYSQLHNCSKVPITTDNRIINIILHNS